MTKWTLVDLNGRIDVYFSYLNFPLILLVCREKY
jgi:hypothetical protein